MYIEFDENVPLPYFQPRFTLKYHGDMIAWRVVMGTRIRDSIYTKVDFWVEGRKKPQFEMNELQKMAFLTLQDLTC